MTSDAHVTGIWCGQIGGGVGKPRTPNPSPKTLPPLAALPGREANAMPEGAVHCASTLRATGSDEGRPGPM